VASLSAKLPLTLGGLLLLCVVGLGARHVWDGDGPELAVALAALAMYVAWIVAETKLVSMRETKLSHAPRDAGSCELYALAQGATVLSALIMPTLRPLGGAASVIGLALLVGFASLRLRAIVVLGRHYSRRVRLLPDHRAIVSGPYRLVRHPAYLGTLVAHLGFVLVFFNWVSLAVWAALFVPMVIRRILVEEAVLLELEGYADYARRTKRLVPWVW